MTIIAAVHDGERYAIAGDSWTSMSDYGRGLATGGKVWRAGEWLFGGAGIAAQNRRARSWLTGHWPTLGLDGGLNDEEKLCRGLEALHQHLMQHAPAPGPGEHGDSGLSLVVVGPSGIWHLGRAGDVLRCERYFAVGNAEDFAMGVLWQLGQFADVLPTDAARIAVSGCIEHFSGCEGPVEVLDHHLLGGRC